MATTRNSSAPGDAPDADTGPGGQDAGAPEPGSTADGPVSASSERLPWLAQALSIAAVMFAGAALVGPRLAETLAVFTGGQSGQLGVYVRILVGDGVTALLGVFLSVLALVTAGAQTRPWVRALAVAALIVSGIAVVVAVVTFFLMPAPQPQPPGIG